MPDSWYMLKKYLWTEVSDFQEFKTQKRGQSMARNTYDKGSAAACLQAEMVWGEKERVYLGW